MNEKHSVLVICCEEIATSMTLAKTELVLRREMLMYEKRNHMSEFSGFGFGQMEKLSTEDGKTNPHYFVQNIWLNYYL